MVTATPHTGITAVEPEIRLAATFTGGVSLAIWMGGVAREMNLLSAASRLRQGRPGAVGAAVAPVRDKYGSLLELVGVRFGIDVLSGTSAGGINAAVLGLAEVWQTDLGLLRDIWLSQGSLGKLLRRPSDRAQPSLLYGDEVLLAGLSDGLRDIMATNPQGADADSPVRVMITTTLLKGEDSRYTDDYGTLIRDTTHRGLFTFTAADLARPEAFRALALAGRSSASFPAAFEPAFLPLDGSGSGDGHPAMAPYIDITRAQHCADGGLLANRPLAPALEAIFDRPADREIRRILAYVVPSAGLPEANQNPNQNAGGNADGSAAGSARASVPGVVPSPPVLGQALMWDLNAALSQSISAELAALTTHNEQARARRRADGQLARLAAGGGAVTPPVYARFRDQHAHALARTAAEEALRQRTLDGQRAPDNRPVGFGADADLLTGAGEEAVAERLPALLPAPGDHDALARYGRTTLDGAMAIVLGLLTAGFTLRPTPDERARLDGLVARAHQAVPVRSGSALQVEVAAALASADRAGASALAGSEAWRAAVRSQLPSDTEQAALAGAWSELGAVIRDAHPHLAALLARARAQAPPITAPATGLSATDERTRLADLLHYLTDDGVLTADQAVARLFELQVLQLVLSPDQRRAPQAVELVQISADTRSALDVRSLAAQKLTGLQLHHFGAFYKSSWCANDWMWGRLDGSGWLVQLLLDPRHLSRMAVESGDPAAYRRRLVDELRRIAESDPPPGVQDPFPDGRAPELEFLTASASDRLPRSLPITAIWVAGGLQRLIAADELATVAAQAIRDADGGSADHVEEFLATYRQAVPGDGDAYPPAPPEHAARLLAACRVSDEKLGGELGTPQMSETLARTAAVATKSVSSAFELPWVMRCAAGVVRSATTVAYRVEHRVIGLLPTRRSPAGGRH
ncbi:patatin-like protein [Kitasatospora sp. NPDC049285]|uniref:patatin-like protein n=1 Tax=Kitasatospora sp. NPDC049285 TaxID=3157096 RepID=UPI00341FF614